MTSYDGGVGLIAGPSSPPAPAARVGNQYISLQGIGFSSGHVRSFDAVCGPNPPTPVGGYGKWTELERPYSDSYTIYQGRTATALQLNLIFGFWLGTGWMQDDSTGQQIEAQISSLEWMAGQGFHYGPSPVVYAWSYSTSGSTAHPTQTSLIPADYQNMPFIIADGIQWGTAYRNPNGYRIWQECTFTLKNYLNLAVAPKPDLTVTGGYYTTTRQRNTALLIAGAPDVASPTTEAHALADMIIKAGLPGNADGGSNNPIKGTNIRLYRKGIKYAMRAGLNVWVPGHQRN